MYERELNKITKQIGIKIKRYREAQHMTQKDLAERAEISKTYISDIENGKKTNLTIMTLYMLAKALNIRIVDLIYWIDEDEFDEGVKDEEYSSMLLRNELILRSLYPDKYSNYKVTTLLEFLLYLPLIDEKELYYILQAIQGDILGKEDYVCSKINRIVELIPDSPVKAYADKQCEILNKKRIERKDMIYDFCDIEEYADTYVELLRLKYEKIKFENMYKYNIDEMEKKIQKCIEIE